MPQMARPDRPGTRGREFDAIYFGPDDDEGVSCKATPCAASLELSKDGSALASLDYRGVEISSAGMDDRYLCFEAASDKGTERALVVGFEIADEMESLGAPRQIVDKLRAATAKRARRRAGRWGVLAALAGSVTALVLFAWAVFEWAVNRSVESIPVEWEIEIGRSSASSVLSETRACADPDLARAINEIGTRLAAGIGASRYDLRIRVLDDPDPNAFALPGGYVFINSGLVGLAHDGAEVAGVLAHELQHVIRRHGMANLIRRSGFGLLLSALSGGVGDVQRLLMVGAAGLASMSYSRDQEREADLKGLELMYSASLDVAGLPRLLERLESEAGGRANLPALLSTHPESASRIVDLERAISANPQAGSTPLTSDWLRIRDRCAPHALSDPDAF